MFFPHPYVCDQRSQVSLLSLLSFNSLIYQSSVLENMVEILDIPWYADKKRILRNIKAKAKSCGYPTHWLLREPVKVNEQMWLRAKDVDKRRGERVQVRRVLYSLTYKSLPLKRITMVCGDDRCINPAHMRIRGWEDEANEFIDEQIEKGWLDPTDAKEYFGWENTHNLKLPEKFSKDIEIEG